MDNPSRHYVSSTYIDYFHTDTDDDRLLYLVQELVNGKSLAELVKRGWHRKNKSSL
ncbi:MAG: hypothetical protein EBE86_011540 [Hormoscilla sp. GUM202]|nr:hypothetical protein [Hormoscilla sp. GUM202]